MMISSFLLLDPFFTKKQPFLKFAEFYLIYASILLIVINVNLGLQNYARFLLIRSNIRDLSFLYVTGSTKRGIQSVSKLSDQVL